MGISHLSNKLVEDFTPEELIDFVKYIYSKGGFCEVNIATVRALLISWTMHAKQSGCIIKNTLDFLKKEGYIRQIGPKISDKDIVEAMGEVNKEIKREKEMGLRQ